MATTCSAPGKIYLFGEHAVVYGEPAIACAIELRTNVTVKKSNTTIISSGLGTTGFDFDIHPYVSTVIKKLNLTKVSIEIKSQIPFNSGLGSSAAVTVATIAAINTEFNLGYDYQNIAKIGHEIETEVQGRASQTDTFVSTYGGAVEIQSKKTLSPPDCSIVIGNTKKDKKTSVIVKKVAQLKHDYPDEVNLIIQTIGALTKKGETFIKKKDYFSLGKLMNINHGLLEALGVGTLELSQLVYAARNSGAYGAKITGSGGGGCMIALTDSPFEVASAIEKSGGEAIITNFSPYGVLNETNHS